MAVTLVLRALGLGDLLTSVPALRALRRARPDDEIVLAAPAPLAPLVGLLDAVDVLLPTPRLGALRRSAADGALPRPDLAVNLHGRGPQSIADLLDTDPGRLITHRHPDRPRLDGPAWRDDLHEVARWGALLAYHGIPVDPGELWVSPPPEPSPAPGAVVIHPGAAFPARRWPPERFAAVARALADDVSAAVGPAPPVIVTGSEAERPLAVDVAERAGLGHEAVFVGQDLAGLATLVAGASLVVCGDTGVGHLATAFGTPSVLLFGPTSPDWWGPPAERPQHVVLWAGTVGDPHAQTPDPGLLRLTVPAVTEAARTLLVGGVPCRTSRTSTTDSPPGRGNPHERTGSRSVSSVWVTSD
ncbi:glycosyltransferase family 9 protein [Saccharomonospora sp.]|uniref:glycosyltransferase family 9 protein n=1 Tax=Saccharomonospora sp. TaxID=33913 RepID=UPI00262EFBDF|nr:glycosyltransferase family 9 protein [Saccharomonospora sp.]